MNQVPISEVMGENHWTSMTQITPEQIVTALENLADLAGINPLANLPTIKEFIRRVKECGIEPPDGMVLVPKNVIDKGWNIVASSRHLGVLIDPESLAELLTAAPKQEVKS